MVAVRLSNQVLSGSYFAYPAVSMSLILYINDTYVSVISNNTEWCSGWKALHNLVI